MDPLSLTAVFVYIVLSLVLGGLAGYLTGYGKKKGENLATKEDMKDVLEQVSQVTATTKKIEAEITSDVWNRQKHWELRRDVLFEATKRLAELDDALLARDAVMQMVEKDRTNKKEVDVDAEWAEQTATRTARWGKASVAFEETRLLVGIVCGNETKHAFDELVLLTNDIAAGIIGKNTQIYTKSQAELGHKLIAVRLAIRKELGVGTTS